MEDEGTPPPPKKALNGKFLNEVSKKTKKKMERRRLERCIADFRNMRTEETGGGWRRMEVPFEGGHGPEGAVAPYVDGWNITSSFISALHFKFTCFQTTSVQE
jgi:hypothetical protein